MRKFRLALGIVILLCTGGTPNLFSTGNPVSEHLYLTPSNLDEVISARLAGGLIMVRAQLNGQPGNYILDTGASHLFINKNLLSNKTVDAYGIGKSVEVQSSIANRFKIGEIIFEDQPIYKMDMQHLETIKGCKIDGIIGAQLLKEFVLFVDYKKDKVELKPASQFTKKRNLIPMRVHPLKMQGHFPMLAISVEEKEFAFAIDTGAEANIFGEKFEKDISSQTKNLHTGKIRSIAEAATSVRNFTLSNMECLGLNYQSMGFIFSDLQSLNQAYDVELDGILGYPFLRRHPFSINFKNNKLIIWEVEKRTSSN